MINQKPSRMKYDTNILRFIYQDHQQLILAADRKAVFYFSVHALVAGVYATLLTHFGFPDAMNRLGEYNDWTRDTVVAIFWISLLSTILAFLVGIGSLLYFVVIPRYYWLKDPPNSLIYAKSIRTNFKSSKNYIKALDEKKDVRKDLAEEIFILAGIVNMKMKGLTISAWMLFVYLVMGLLQFGALIIVD